MNCLSTDNKIRKTTTIISRFSSVVVESSSVFLKSHIYREKVSTRPRHLLSFPSNFDSDMCDIHV